MNTSTFDVYDSNQYKIFTGPAQLEKDLNTLYGCIQGIRADDEINEQEIAQLQAWLDSVRPLEGRHPYKTIIPFVENALADGEVTQEEASDIAWLCLQYLDKDKPYFDFLTTSIQKLSGLLTGIAADRKINFDELELLNNWLSTNSFLQKTWLFDSLNPLVQHAIETESISPETQKAILTICDSVSSHTPTATASTTENALIQQLVTDNISVTIPEFSFCLTGASKKYARKEIAAIIEMYGGYMQDTVSSKLHYLVVCDEKNTCWAFASYGRKIEKAMDLKKKGKGPEVIYEEDLFFALKSLGHIE